MSETLAANKTHIPSLQFDHFLPAGQYGLCSLVIIRFRSTSTAFPHRHGPISKSPMGVIVAIFFLIAAKLNNFALRRDCYKINGRNALAVYYIKTTINELLSFTGYLPYRASVVIYARVMMNQGIAALMMIHTLSKS